MSSRSKVDDSLSDIWNLKRRGKRDLARHKELVRRAIKSQKKELITEYNIITSDGNKKVKVPIKFLDQYKFKYGKLKKKTGAGHSLDAKPGDKYRVGNRKKKKGSGKAGDEKGEHHYEVEVSFDEIVDVLLEELNLPWMEPKNATSYEVETEELSSIEKKGPLSNLDLKKTLIENIKRNASKGDPKVGDFVDQDLRYRQWETEVEYHSNAAVYLMMDRSGSMSKDKTYIAKSFYFWMVQFLKRRYKNIELYFIAHDVEAWVETEDEFFKSSSGGGTKCSSAFKLAYESIKKNNNPESWNNYVFEFSDGDNWVDDNMICLEYVEKLLPLVTAMGYGEIIVDDPNSWVRGDHMLSTMFNRHIDRTRFISVQISDHDEVFEALKLFFNIEGSSKGRKSLK